MQRGTFSHYSLLVEGKKNDDLVTYKEQFEISSKARSVY